MMLVGSRHADGVAHLDQALAREAGGDDVLRHIARGVGRRAVHLGRVLAGEGAAAVRACAAVGVDDDLAPGQAAVALRAADHEAAGRVDQVLDVSFSQFLRQHGLMISSITASMAACFIFGPSDISGECWVESTTVSIAIGLAVHVAQGDLRLGVRAQPRQAAVLAQHAPGARPGGAASRSAAASAPASRRRRSRTSGPGRRRPGRGCRPCAWSTPWAMSGLCLS